MSNSTRKMKVVVTDSPWGKRWAKVTMKNSYTFYPSFEDLFRIIQAIAFCEDGKYPQGKGRKLLAEFLTDCVYETKFDFLAGKYNIPIRENEQVKNTNGAWKNKR